MILQVRNYAKLLRKDRGLREEIRHLREEEKGSFPETGDDQGDLACKDVQIELSFLQIEWRVKQENNIWRALEKIREGTYGICDRCHKLIPSERLKVQPQAVLCLSCAKSEIDRPSGK